MTGFAAFSNYGSNSVDLAAPGVSIYTTVWSGGYYANSGTSFAAPHVAGVAGLVRAQEPGISVSTLKSRILGSVDLTPSLQGRMVTGGRLNAYRALDGTSWKHNGWVFRLTDLGVGTTDGTISGIPRDTHRSHGRGHSEMVEPRHSSIRAIRTPLRGHTQFR